jgi:hypothetical protein
VSFDDNDDLRVVDTSKLLTLDELKELKRLASMSKSARFLFAIMVGAISLFGIDKLFDLLHGHWK